MPKREILLDEDGTIDAEFSSFAGEECGGDLDKFLRELAKEGIMVKSKTVKVKPGGPQTQSTRTSVRR